MTRQRLAAIRRARAARAKQRTKRARRRPVGPKIHKADDGFMLRCPHCRRQLKAASPIALRRKYAKHFGRCHDTGAGLARAAGNLFLFAVARFVFNLAEHFPPPPKHVGSGSVPRKLKE